MNLVITKSVRRFAGNTSDALNCICRLKALNILIIFEKESVNTPEASGEIWTSDLMGEAGKTAGIRGILP